MNKPTQPGYAVFLVLATLAAFAYAQLVKRDPLVLDRVSFVGAPHNKGTERVHSFTPDDDCRHIRFRLAQDTTQLGTPTELAGHG